MVTSHLAHLVVFFSSVLFLVVIATLDDDHVPDNTCVCSVQDSPLYTKAGYEHHLVQYLLANTCVFTAGDNSTVFGSYWFNLRLTDRILWSAAEYLAMGKIQNDVCGLP